MFFANLINLELTCSNVLNTFMVLKKFVYLKKKTCRLITLSLEWLKEVPIYQQHL